MRKKRIDVIFYSQTIYVYEFLTLLRLEKIQFYFLSKCFASRNIIDQNSLSEHSVVNKLHLFIKFESNSWVRYDFCFCFNSLEVIKFRNFLKLVLKLDCKNWIIWEFDSQISLNMIWKKPFRPKPYLASFLIHLNKSYLLIFHSFS
jgi:hypothetical protein